MTLILVSCIHVHVNAYMDIDIDSAGRTSEICWWVFLFKPSILRSERWRRAAVMNFMADGTRLEMFCTSPCQSDWREIRNFLPLTLTSNSCLSGAPLFSRGSPSFHLIFLTRSAFGGSLLQGVPSIAMGERIEGQCFPIVYQPTKITCNSFQNPNLSTH